MQKIENNSKSRENLNLNFSQNKKLIHMNSISLDQILQDMELYSNDGSLQWLSNFEEENQF
jgi:hypothetical protein